MVYKTSTYVSDDMFYDYQCLKVSGEVAKCMVIGHSVAVMETLSGQKPIQPLFGVTHPVDGRSDAGDSLPNKSQIPPIRNRRDQGDEIGESIDRVDPQHQRIGESFAVGGGVGEHMPVDLIGEKPDFGGD